MNSAMPPTDHDQANGAHGNRPPSAAALGEQPMTTMQRRLAVRERPLERPVMYQSWQELLFLHWEVDAELVQATLPAGLTVDTFGGRAWVGIVPFFMRSIRPCWSPPVPGISNFQELNCRTYVVDRQGTPGVWFYSLDTDSRLAVWWARQFFHLPYHYARMSHEWDRRSGRVEFRSHRRGTHANCASRFVYAPQGEPATSVPGTLEFFLVERYVLFADDGDRKGDRNGDGKADGRLRQGIVHHPPYLVCPVDVEAFDDSLLGLNGFPRTGTPPDHALLSRGVDVDVFPLQAATG